MSHCSYSPFAEGTHQRIDALGEVALLAKIREWLGEASPPSPQGIGDDCAVWPQPPQGRQLLFTTDAIVYGRHFDASCPPELAAAKLLKRNLSDIAAMGGTPHSALLALTLPRNLSLPWLEKFYLGLRECSLRYATPVTGGDITEGTDNFFAAHITLVGHAKRPLLRTGAKTGDHLFVTGALGGSICGHHLHFEPRLAEGCWLAAQPDVCAMIDLTDGLAKDLPELLPAGNAGVSSRVEMSSEYFQAKGQSAQGQSAAADGNADVEAQRIAVVNSDMKVQRAAAGEIATSHPQAGAAHWLTAVALLDLDALPLATAALSSTQAGQAAEAISPETGGFASAKPEPPGTASAAIARALSDGEDYELLFAVDSQTDPAEFIRRWQTFFSIKAPPAAGSPAHPQPAYPYCIGHIAEVGHPAGASRLYDAASGKSLELAQSGFEHLSFPES